MGNFNKEIQKLKIAVTSDCTLNCKHCNIEHKKAETVNIQYAKKAIDFFLATKGYYKRLELYGGEPFLRLPILKDLTKYAKNKALENKKKLSVSIATNLTILSDEIIKFIKEYSINISISFSGTPQSHNYNRVFPDGKKSYPYVLKNIKKLIKEIGSDYLVCLYCIDKGFVKNFEKDIKKIKSLGFKLINFETVYGCGWQEKDYKLLEKNFRKLLGYLDINTPDKWLIPEPFIEYIKNHFKDDYYYCPFYKDLELYPDGYFGFYPYAFLDYKKYKNKIVIGKQPIAIGKKFLKCNYTEKCIKDCIDRYYSIKSELNDGSYAYKIRTFYIRSVFKEILNGSKKNKSFKNYLKECCRIFKLTYI